MTTYIPTPACEHVLSIEFIHFSNPTDQKATGINCDDDGTACDILLDICISRKNSR